MPRRLACLIGLLAGVACGSFGANPSPVGAEGGSNGSDGGPARPDGSSSPTRCDVTKRFGPPRLVPGLDTPFSEGGASLSSDGRLLVYHANTSTGDASFRLFASTRPSTDSLFDTGRMVGQASSGATMNDPHLTPDNVLLFAAADPGGRLRILSAKLNDDLTLDAPEPVAAFASDTAITLQPYATSARVYVALRPSGDDPAHIHAAARDANGVLAAPEIVGELVGSGWDWRPVVTPDDLAIYFARAPSGDVHGMDIFVARRNGRDAPFGVPEPVRELNEANAFDHPTWVSADECTCTSRATADQTAAATYGSPSACADAAQSPGRAHGCGRPAAIERTRSAYGLSG